MLKFLIFIGAFVLVHSGSSPHGERYLKSLSPEQLSKIPREIMEDALLDAVSVYILKLLLQILDILFYEDF